jgi:hypothetical protein
MPGSEKPQYEIAIRFKKASEQSRDMRGLGGDNLPEGWHIIIGVQDYTACGMGTNEYAKETKRTKITCPQCIATIKQCKQVRL